MAACESRRRTPQRSTRWSRRLGLRIPRSSLPATLQAARLKWRNQPALDVPIKAQQHLGNVIATWPPAHLGLALTTMQSPLTGHKGAVAFSDACLAVHN